MKFSNVMKAAVAISLFSATNIATAQSSFDNQFVNYPTYSGDDLELSVSDAGTSFRLWSPKAEEVIVSNI